MMHSPRDLADSPTPHSRRLRVVAAALDQDATPAPGAPSTGYTVMLKLSRVLDVTEARLLSERNPFLHATAGSRKLLAVDTTVETIREESHMIQLLLAEVESDALAEEARRREDRRREAERIAAEQRRRNEVLGAIEW